MSVLTSREHHSTPPAPAAEEHDPREQSLLARAWESGVRTCLMSCSIALMNYESGVVTMRGLRAIFSRGICSPFRCVRADCRLPV